VFDIRQSPRILRDPDITDNDKETGCRGLPPHETITWEAIVIFRFEDGKIAEEWVSRDELGMLRAAGILQPNVARKQ
jgi:SnoaL-like polyketide cyclase